MAYVFGGDEAGGGLTAAQQDAAAAFAVVASAPYEGTVSYGGGTARGPQAIIDASASLELYDEELDRVTADCGIHTAPPLALDGLAPAAMADAVAAEVRRWLARDKFVVLLGGEHSVTGGAIRPVAEKFPGVGVLHLDAHGDTRQVFHGTPHSHACAMARVHDHVRQTVSIGIRALGEEERASLHHPERKIFLAHAWPDLAALTEPVLAALPDTIYLTIDLDFFAPHVIPATGTPEPGGYEWYPTMALLREVFKRKRVVSCDVVELAPLAHLSYPDFTAAKLVYKLIGWAAARR